MYNIKEFKITLLVYLNDVVMLENKYNKRLVLAQKRRVGVFLLISSEKDILPGLKILAQ